MSEWTKDQEQVELFQKRSEAAGIDRRTFLRIMAAASATAIAAACAPQAPAPAAQQAPAQQAPAQPAPAQKPAEQKPAQPAAPAAAPKADAGAAVADDQQIFRSASALEPSSHDFNKDLYCAGETELFAGLMRFDTDYKPVPYVAEKFETKNDGTVYVFTIKKGGKWSNGDPVTAKDFEYSFKRQLNPDTKAPYAAFLFDIKNAEKANTKKDGVTIDQVGVKATDDYTLEITLESARGYFPTVMAYTAALPSHRPSVEKFGDKWTEAANIVTNGPWKLTVWEHEKRMVYERFEDFTFGPKAKLKKRYAPIIPTEAQLAAYEKGELDRAYVAQAEIKRLQADPKLSKELVIFSLTGTFYLAPSYAMPPFDKKEVRRALSHAINREQLVKTVLQGVGAPAYTFVPPDSPGYVDPAKNTWLKDLIDYNPQKAKDMLKGTPYDGAKGWPKVTLTFRSDELAGVPGQMAQAIQAQLKENLNMDVELEGLENRVFRDRMFAKKIQLNYIRWYMDYPDPNNNLYLVWYSNRESGLRHEYKDAEFDKMVTEAASATSTDKRMELYTAAERRMLEDGAATYIYYPFGARVYKPWVQGLPKSTSGLYAQDWNIYFGLPNEVFITDHPDRPKLS